MAPNTSSSPERPTVFVSWPSAPLTDSLVRRSLAAIETPFSLTSVVDTNRYPLVQWSTYGAIEHELAHSDPANVLISSYTIRKALIRKHFLSRCLQSYVTKHPNSILKTAVPRTWDIDISFSEDLDEMWADDLWDLGLELDTSSKWWILKPGMADRGNGIRLFNSKDALRRIFEGFEIESDEDEETDNTTVMTSQLRHFVLQEYLSNPLLFDPTRISRNAPNDNLSDFHGHKFHLRAYCVSSGALKVYLCTRVLALFSDMPYTLPVDGEAVDLRPHLTNTSLQTHRGEEGVFLLDELVGCLVLSSQDVKGPTTLEAEDVVSILDQICEVLAETFKAASENPVHFQLLPNAFELFGVDFLITHEHEPLPPKSSSRSHSKLPLQVRLLEINAEPAIELTGPRLTWILEELFVATGKVCVEPFLSRGSEDSKEVLPWVVGETRYGLRKCLEVDTMSYR